MFGLPKLGARVCGAVRQEQLLPAFKKLAGDRVWLVRGSAAATVPAMAALLPAGAAACTWLCQVHMVPRAPCT